MYKRYINSIIIIIIILETQESVDELALNISRREENAASLALKFLKPGCQNIHLWANILKADICEKEQMR